MKPERVTGIHITGASGTGTTTLGRALANELGCAHLDTDDYYWLPTQPPYREKREIPERVRLLQRDLTGAWVLSGSLAGWGDPLVPHFDLVVFLLVPTEIRLARLRRREAAAGLGDEEFFAWAASYDDGGTDIRSRARHEPWLAALACPVVRIEGDTSTDERMRRVRNFL